MTDRYQDHVVKGTFPVAWGKDDVVYGIAAMGEARRTVASIMAKRNICVELFAHERDAVGAIDQRR